jgi:integrase
MDRNRGQGSIINRAGTAKLYIRYWTNGRQIQEAVGSDSREDAERLLQQRMGEAGLGMRPAQDVKGVKYDDIRDSYLAEHPADRQTKTKLEYLDGFFEGRRVIDIDSDVIRSFIKEKRDKDLLADPTIRRILVILRSMFNQAKKESKVRHTDVPYFPMPADSKPRQGFIQPDQFAKLHAALPANLRPLIKFMYFTGCRVGAATQITWKMISRDGTEVELPGEITKNGEPLMLPLVGPLAEIATMLKKMFRDGSKPVFSQVALRRGWCKACHSLGLGVYDEETRQYKGLTVHDLRRSAVRNLIRAGVDRGTAMSITAHKTEHVFERYNITDVDDRKAALIKVGEFAARQTKEAAARS